MHDALLSRELSLWKGSAAKLQAPIATALPAAGVVLPFGVSADPEISRSAAEKYFARACHVAPVGLYSVRPGGYSNIGRAHPPSQKS